MQAPGPCIATEGPAPVDNPHGTPRGVVLDMPYNKEAIGRIKQLPRWAWSFDGDDKDWIVDRLVWPYVKVVLSEQWGKNQQPETEDTGDDDEDPSSNEAAPEPANPTLFG